MNWETLVAKIRDIALDWGPKVIAALAILAGGWVAARIARRILHAVMSRARFEPTLVGFLSDVAYVLLLTIVVVASLERLGVSTASFVAVIGAAGLAVAFALQGSLSNFAAGVIIIVFRPFRVGDVIEGAGTIGTVEEIQMFATVLKSADNKRIVIPNSSLTGSNIVNYTANPHRRVDLVFGISYGDDIARAKEVVRSILANHPLVLKDPPPEVVVGQLADSSVNLFARPWVKPADYWRVTFDVTEAVKSAFDRQGIKIPFPQRDVHLRQVA